MTEIQKAVIDAVRMVPRGRVVSYGQVALQIGHPRGARMVGWILRGMESVDIPWWRVINNAGRITIKGNKFNSPQSQRKLLEDEGVTINDKFEIDIEAYRYFYN